MRKNIFGNWTKECLGVRVKLGLNSSTLSNNEYNKLENKSIPEKCYWHVSGELLNILYLATEWN